MTIAAKLDAAIKTDMCEPTRTVNGALVSQPARDAEFLHEQGRWFPIVAPPSYLLPPTSCC